MGSPAKFAHVVLKTNKYEAMVAWWCDFLGAHVRHGNDFISFLSYDEEHHRIAIASLPHLQDAESLFAQFERMKAKGIHPYWTINHGFTLSAYYRDPDGNQVETQVDSMTMEEADAFMHGPLFAANPIGINVDFDALLARWRAGEPASSITDYATAGA
jgi:catechol-2,3-dioxygenase